MSACVCRRVLHSGILTSSAVQLGWHGDGDVEVLGLGLRETVGARDIVAHLQGRLPCSTQSVAGGVQVTLRYGDQQLAHCEPRVEIVLTVKGPAPSALT